MMKDCCIYSWGANTRGQLSLEHCEDVHQPALTTCPWMDSIGKDVKITEMDGGANHMMIIDGEGNLYACGDNRNSQLLLPSHSETKLTTFAKVMGGVTSVSCGWDFSVAARRDGSVLHSNHPGRIFENEFGGKRVCKVSCGVYHCFALAEDHALFGFGSNKHGELGQNVKSADALWTRVAGNVKDVKAGLNHSLLLMQDGTLQFLGRNKFGQCPPSTITSGRILGIGSGWNHTIIITGTESHAFHAHCYGKNDMGQLGSADTTLNYHCFGLPFKPLDLQCWFGACNDPV